MTKTWIITGSSIGLGRAIVKAALDSGNNVVATARKPEMLSDLASQFPDQLLVRALDVTDARQAREVAAAAIARFGRIDVLVNNAGFSGIGSIEDIPIELINELFATNFTGAVHLCQAVLGQMRTQGRGWIIFVSSIGARMATPGVGIYYATKAALSALAETLALEVESFGIRVTAIEPGAMRTRFAKAESMKVARYNPVYNDTVGATIAALDMPQFTANMQDPAYHAKLIIELAALERPPVRLMADAAAYERGYRADEQRRANDILWQSLSRTVRPI